MYCSSQKERTVDKICLFLRALHMDRISKLGGTASSQSQWLAVTVFVPST